MKVDEFQQTTVSHVYCAGEATGIGGLELSLVEGEIAGLAAAGKRDAARKLFAVREKQRKFADLLNRTFALRDELKKLPTPETIVCRCEDVHIRAAARASIRGVRRSCKRAAAWGHAREEFVVARLSFCLDGGHESVRPPVLPVRSRVY